MARIKLVFVGNGMAGLRAVEELLMAAPDQHDITIFGDEPHPNRVAYDRGTLINPMLVEGQVIGGVVWEQCLSAVKPGNPG